MSGTKKSKHKGRVCIASYYRGTCAVQCYNTIWVYKIESRWKMKDVLSYELGSDQANCNKLLLRCSLYKSYKTRFGLHRWLKQTHRRFLSSENSK